MPEPHCLPISWRELTAHRAAAREVRLRAAVNTHCARLCGRLLCGLVLLGWLIAAATAQVTAASPRQTRSGNFQAVPCSSFKITGDEFECGYVRVPELYAQPDGRQIQLAVAILPSTGVSPTRNAFVMAQGGPGGSTLDLFAQFVQLGYYPALEDLRAARDIVLYDQRGALYSQPALVCPEELETTLATLERELSREQELEQSAQAALSCRARLIGEGVNLAAYNSIENARDIEALRRALGYDQFDFYGISYGTLLALHGMRETPDTFRSVVLDAVVPAQINPNATVALSQNRAFKELFRACAANADCDRAYPNLKQVFYQTVDALNKQPARVPLRDNETGKTYDAVISGDTFMDILFQFIYNSELIPALPQMIYGARDGKYNLVEAFYPLVVFDRTFASGMYYSVMCAEDADFAVDDLALDGVDEHIARVQQRDTAAFLDLCARWNVPQLGSWADEPVRSGIPTLLFSGEFDPITPPPFGQAAAQNITPSYPFVFPAYGHGALTSGNCPNRIVVEFVSEPRVPPDAQCIAESARVPFITPAGYLLVPGVGKLQYDLVQGKIGSFLVPLGLLLLLLSVFVVAPLGFFVRLAQKRPAGRNRWARLAPWFAAAAGAFAALFFLLLLAYVLYIALNNDNTVSLVLGALRGVAFVFLLPLLSALATGLLCLAVILGWVRGNWHLAWRVYYTLLALAAVGLSVWFATNGILSAAVA